MRANTLTKNWSTLFSALAYALRVINEVSRETRGSCSSHNRKTRDSSTIFSFLYCEEFGNDRCNQRTEKIEISEKLFKR